MRWYPAFLLSGRNARPLSLVISVLGELQRPGHQAEGLVELVVLKTETGFVHPLDAQLAVQGLGGAVVGVGELGVAPAPVAEISCSALLPAHQPPAAPFLGPHRHAGGHRRRELHRKAAKGTKQIQ